MNRNAALRADSRRHIALAKRRVAQGQIPRGASRGIMAGQPQAQAPVPQGADQGVMAGCGVPGYGYASGPGYPGAAPGYGCPPAYWPNIPSYSNTVTRDCPDYIGGTVNTLGLAGTTCCEIVPNKFMTNVYGLKFLGQFPQGSINIDSLVVGPNDETEFENVDALFFNQTDQCWCPVDFCISRFFPAELSLTFNLVGSTVPIASFVFVGESVEWNSACTIPDLFISPTVVPQAPIQGPIAQCVPQYAEGQFGGAAPMPYGNGMNGNGGPANNPWG